MMVQIFFLIECLPEANLLVMLPCYYGKQNISVNSKAVGKFLQVAGK